MHPSFNIFVHPTERHRASNTPPLLHVLWSLLRLSTLDHSGAHEVSSARLACLLRQNLESETRMPACVFVRLWLGLGMVWSGLVWSGLVWSGLVWSGLVYNLSLVWSNIFPSHAIAVSISVD